MLTDLNRSGEQFDPINVLGLVVSVESKTVSLRSGRKAFILEVGLVDSSVVVPLSLQLWGDSGRLYKYQLSEGFIILVENTNSCLNRNGIRYLKGGSVVTMKLLQTEARKRQDVCYALEKTLDWVQRSVYKDLFVSDGRRVLVTPTPVRRLSEALKYSSRITIDLVVRNANNTATELVAFERGAFQRIIRVRVTFSVREKILNSIDPNGERWRTFRFFNVSIAAIFDGKITLLNCDEESSVDVISSDEIAGTGNQNNDDSCSEVTYGQSHDTGHVAISISWWELQRLLLSEQGDSLGVASEILKYSGKLFRVRASLKFIDFPNDYNPGISLSEELISLLDVVRIPSLLFNGQDVPKEKLSVSYRSLYFYLSCPDVIDRENLCENSEAAVVVVVDNDCLERVFAGIEAKYVLLSLARRHFGRQSVSSRVCASETSSSPFQSQRQQQASQRERRCRLTRLSTTLGPMISTLDATHDDMELTVEPSVPATPIVREEKSVKSALGSFVREVGPPNIEANSANHLDYAMRVHRLLSSLESTANKGQVLEFIIRILPVVDDNGILMSSIMLQLENICLTNM